MPRSPARLVNCYVPLVLPSGAATDTSKDEGQANSVADPSSQLRRRDGRQHDALRQVVLETSVLGPALGSSLVEFGHTKVLCEVHLVSGISSPIQGNNSSNNESSDTDVGRLFCTIKFAPHIGIDPGSQRAQAVGSLNNNTTTAMAGVSMGKLNQQVMQQESGLSHQLTSALQPVVPLQGYPKCTIVVKVTILQDSGSSLSAAITAATLALVDARVELLDLVTSCTVAVTMSSSGDDNGHEPIYLIDPVQNEALQAQAIICLAMTPNHKEVTLWSQSGKLSASMASQAMDLCREGCRTYHKLVREAWLAKMANARDKR